MLHRGLDFKISSRSSAVRWLSNTWGRALYNYYNWRQVGFFYASDGPAHCLLWSRFGPPGASCCWCSSETHIAVDAADSVCRFKWYRCFICSLLVQDTSSDLLLIILLNILLVFLGGLFKDYIVDPVEGLPRGLWANIYDVRLHSLMLLCSYTAAVVEPSSAEQLSGFPPASLDPNML